MRYLIPIFALLAGCSTPGYNQWAANTAAGSELPDTSKFVNYCEKADASGLCAKWKYGNGQIKQP